MTSTRIMVDKLEGMLGTQDLNEWEQGFVRGMVDRRDSKDLTGQSLLLGITEKQIEILTRLHNKHFA